MMYIGAGVAELADALDLGSSGAHPWRFKSSRPHHSKIKGSRVLKILEFVFKKQNTLI